MSETITSNRRLRDFEQWMKDIQKTLSDEDFGKIRHEMDLRGISKDSCIKILSLMRSLDIDTDLFSQVRNRLKDKMPGVIILNPDLENILLNMFDQIQEPWTRLQPIKRRSFFSRSYVLYKLLQLLGEEKRYPSCSLSREKLQNNDSYWMQICRELNWKFMPSS